MGRDIVLLLILAVMGTSFPLADAVTVTKDRYALRAFTWNDSKVRVLTFTAGGGVILKKAMAYRRFSGRQTVSSMGRASHALAATNGDFRMLNTQAPKHLSVVDGEIMSTGNPKLPGWVLRTSADGTKAWIGRPVFDVRATQGTTSFDVVGWNAQQPHRRSVVAFTARGGRDRYPTAKTCSALLAPVSGVREPDRVYRVVKVRKKGSCSREPLQPPKGKVEHVVLTGKPLRQVRAGAQIELHVGLGGQGVIKQVIGGVPLLVRQGVNVGPSCDGTCPKSGPGPDGPFGAENARTAIGISQGCSDVDDTTECTYYMVTVDGRHTKWSEGLRFPPMADLMLELGAYNALNIDGGGNTQMWVRDRNVLCQRRTEVGCLVNRPSYGERAVLDAVVLVPAPS
jgi:phosphodiester glycosidase